MIEGLKDKVVIVTGAAHGIGKAYCVGFAKAGARVVIADIDKPGAGRSRGRGGRRCDQEYGRANPGELRRY